MNAGDYRWWPRTSLSLLNSLICQKGRGVHASSFFYNILVQWFSTRVMWEPLKGAVWCEEISVGSGLSLPSWSPTLTAWPAAICKFFFFKLGATEFTNVMVGYIKSSEGCLETHCPNGYNIHLGNGGLEFNTLLSPRMPRECLLPHAVLSCTFCPSCWSCIEIAKSSICGNGKKIKRERKFLTLW